MNSAPSAAPTPAVSGLPQRGPDGTWPSDANVVDVLKVEVLQESGCEPDWLREVSGSRLSEMSVGDWAALSPMDRMSAFPVDVVNAVNQALALPGQRVEPVVVRSTPLRYVALLTCYLVASLIYWLPWDEV